MPRGETIGTAGTSPRARPAAAGDGACPRENPEFGTSFLDSPRPGKSRLLGSSVGTIGVWPLASPNVVDVAGCENASSLEIIEGG